MEIEVLKRQAMSAAEALGSTLVSLSHDIHRLAEVKFEEHGSAAALVGFLRGRGFHIETGVAGLPTAFVARTGTTGPRLGLVAEYDALPGLGHGCGHNMIGPISVGAASAAAEVLSRAGVTAQIDVIGTPAEEGGGGKVRMVNAGIFDAYDAVMMTHPYRASMRDHGTLAMASIKVTYLGRAAHASAQPHEGINALEAAVQAYQAINGLRQHLPPESRVHGIIREGGTAPNIIPDRSSLHFLVRAVDDSTLSLLKERVAACFQAAARSTGCRCDVEVELEYKARRPNSVLQNVLSANLAVLGFPLGPLPPGDGKGSSDMGDVSRVAPTAQPYFAICEEIVIWHSMEVVTAAVSARADAALVEVSKGLAATCVELATSSDLLREIRIEFEAMKTAGVANESRNSNS